MVLTSPLKDLFGQVSKSFPLSATAVGFVQVPQITSKPTAELTKKEPPPDVGDSIIKVNVALGSQENKGDKMNMLYDYLSSNQFRMQIEAIVEGFSSMKTALDKEKRAMQRIWKEREKQIDKVTINTIDMHSSIKGIAGNAIQSVKALELPEVDDDNLELDL
mgnify:CR=1 FL=1